MKKHLNKVRNMKGVKVGRGSAGQARSARRVRDPEEIERKRAEFARGLRGVEMACREFLAKRGEVFTGMRGDGFRYGSRESRRAARVVALETAECHADPREVAEEYGWLKPASAEC